MQAILDGLRKSNLLGHAHYNISKYGSIDRCLSWKNTDRSNHGGATL